MTQQSESQAMAHEATLFVMQMAGDSMINAGIHNGDLPITCRATALRLLSGASSPMSFTR